MSLRGRLCFAMFRSVLDRPIEKTGEKIENYQAWRNEEMAESWAQFSEAGVDGLDVLDFGCGTGPLSLYLAEVSSPKSITGVDLEPELIALANADLATAKPDMPVRFLVGQENGLPVEDASADRLLAFDVMEHVMDPEAIFADWHRVLRKGGKALLVWVPFAGPFGPHMNPMIPVPWARYVFGERAMFETAERIYDDPSLCSAPLGQG